MKLHETQILHTIIWTCQIKLSLEFHQPKGLKWHCRGPMPSLLRSPPTAHATWCLQHVAYRSGFASTMQSQCIRATFHIFKWDQPYVTAASQATMHKMIQLTCILSFFFKAKLAELHYGFIESNYAQGNVLFIFNSYASVHRRMMAIATWIQQWLASFVKPSIRWS